MEWGNNDRSGQNWLEVESGGLMLSAVLRASRKRGFYDTLNAQKKSPSLFHACTLLIYEVNSWKKKEF